MVIQTIQLKNIFAYQEKENNKTWVSFIQFCINKMQIKVVYQGRNLQLQWYCADKKRLDKYCDFLYKQNINAKASVHTYHPRKIPKTPNCYRLSIYNPLDIEFLFEELSKSSPILEAKITPFLKTLDNHISSSNGSNKLKPLQIKEIKRLHLKSETIVDIAKITGISSKAITKVIYREFNIKRKYVLFGKKIA